MKDHLVRRVVADSGCDLELACVEYERLPGIPGLVTAEPPEEQGLQLDLPNLPPVGGSGAAEVKANLRITEPAPGISRIRFWPDGAAMPPDDGGGLGILVPHPGLASTRRPPLVRVRPRPFGLEVGGVLRTGGDRRQVAGFPLAPALGFGPGRVRFSVELMPDDDVLGFGEQFGRLVKNGQALTLRTADALGCGINRAYKPVPVFHCGDATLFIHTGSVVTADVGASVTSLLQVEVEDEALDLFVITGGDLAERLGRYTDLTGRPKVPPVWAFGLWLGRCRYRTRAELEAAAAGMRRHRIPCDVMHIDPDWLVLDKLNTDFIWSEEKFPDPKGMIAALAGQGFHVSCWELPYIDPASPVYEEAKALGHLVKRADGSPAEADKMSRDGRPRGLVDFSSPAATRWWQDKHASLFEMGIAVMKPDFGEGLPEDAVMSDGRSGRSWHNLYPLRYNAAAFEASERFTGRQGLVWSRSGWAGSQRYPAQWGGDPESSLAGMAATLRGGLSYALSAPGLWSHDIGGFYGPTPSPELYVRWMQFGCLTPLARAHGLSPREPWEFGERALAITRRFVELRYTLIPYLLRCAAEARDLGLPVLRPLRLQFPDDPGCRAVDLQYLLGADLLVCPVFSESPDPVTMGLYLPAGAEWVDWWSGEQLAGGRWIEVCVPLERLPFYRRAGAVIPLGPVVQHTGQLESELEPKSESELEPGSASGF